MHHMHAYACICKRLTWVNNCFKKYIYRLFRVWFIQVPMTTDPFTALHGMIVQNPQFQSRLISLMLMHCMSFIGWNNWQLKRDIVDALAANNESEWFKISQVSNNLKLNELLESCHRDRCYALLQLQLIW